MGPWPNVSGLPALTGRLDQDLAVIKPVLEPCGDISFKPASVGPPPGRSVMLIYNTYLADSTVLQEHILEALLEGVAPASVPVVLAGPSHEAGKVVEQVMRGGAAILADGWPEALLVWANTNDARNIDVPTTEDVVRGPREAFVERLERNIGLIRRRLPNPRFRMERRRIGRLTQSETVLVWLDGIADDGHVSEARRRLDRIQIDSVLDSAYIEELIEDEPYSPFPQIQHTERPDKVAACLLEGQFAILVDGSPYALLAPTLFIHFLQASEDYYERFWLGSVIRLVRLLALLLALLGPALYVAVSSVHQEMIPVGLVLRLAGTREGSPMPLFLEVLLMEIAFEMLREAGLRLPRPAGQAVSIVGGLVIGEAAVRAGIANPITVVVVAMTGIASFALPGYSVAIALRLLRFPILMTAPVLGLPGITTAAIIMLIHLVGLRSFGVPYLSPIGPARYDQWGDTLVRKPWWAMLRRPGPPGRQSRRMPPGQQPGPPMRR